jgi:cellulose synthase (UDP-forming)
VLQQVLERETILPSPPRRSEYYQYLGKAPLRILALVLFILSMGSVYGIWAVFSRGPEWYPFLIMLVVMVPWSIYVVLLQTYRPRVTWKSHQMVRQAGAYMLKHSVDVFVCVCGEEPAVIRNTLYHCLRMNWPGTLNVYVLDDGHSDVIRDLAAGFDVSYLRRYDRPLHKKSGNLNNGLRNSNGEFIAVFDADFAPAPEFLTETLPYMLYDNIGIIQTAQYFDVSTEGTRNWIQRLSGSVQDMFFCWAQPARNAADAAMCVGTNVVYRRAALDACDGFPRVDGGEDVVTGLDMYTEGWRTLYVPLVVAKGVCPDTFDAAINQQYRWARSSMAMFAGKNAHAESLRRAPLSLKQRMVFWSGALYYMQSILVLILAVLPTIVMLWAYPWAITPTNYIPILPAMLGVFALPMIIRGWRPATLRIIVVYSVAHLLAAIDVFTGGYGHWIPTGAKVKSRIPARAAAILRWWIILSQLAMWIAIFRDVPIYGLENYWATIALTVMQTWLLLPLLLPGFGTIGQFSQLPHLFRRHRRVQQERKAITAGNEQTHRVGYSNPARDSRNHIPVSSKEHISEQLVRHFRRADWLTAQSRIMDRSRQRRWRRQRGA